jgi:hypothetical protein
VYQAGPQQGVCYSMVTVWHGSLCGRRQSDGDGVHAGAGFPLTHVMDNTLMTITMFFKAVQRSPVWAGAHSVEAVKQSGFRFQVCFTSVCGQVQPLDVALTIGNSV